MMILEMEQNDDGNNMFLLSLSPTTASGSSCSSSQCSTTTKEDIIIEEQQKKEQKRMMMIILLYMSKKAQNNSSENRTVTFGTVKVMLFVQQIGDNPSVSSGCPIALGSKIYKQLTYQVDTYEKLNPQVLRKTKKQLRMSSEERTQILLRLGYTRSEIISKAKDIYMINVIKRRTNKQKQLDMYYDSIIATRRIEMIGSSISQRPRVRNNYQCPYNLASTILL